MRPWSEVSYCAGRNDLPYLLGVAQWLERDLDPDDLPYAVVNAWSMCEWPEEAMESSMWVTLFEDAGCDQSQFIRQGEDRDSVELKATSTLPEYVTLWRGAPEERRFRMAWTDDRERAEWFADRFSAGYPVWEARVPREFLLAYVTARGESEWIVHPDAWDMVEPHET